MQQRDKLLKKLAEKKSGLKNPVDIAALERSTQIALDQMNKDFDDKEASALRRAQEEVLLALSSIYINESLLNPAPVIAANTKDEEDLHSSSKADEAARISKAADWLSRVDQIKGTYMSASQELQQRLRLAHREATSEMDEAPADTYCGVTTHMMKVPQSL